MRGWVICVRAFILVGEVGPAEGVGEPGASNAVGCLVKLGRCLGECLCGGYKEGENDKGKGASWAGEGVISPLLSCHNVQAESRGVLSEE